MNLQDALFNWLQMHIVAKARPEDRAAKDTLDFFDEILRDDHHLTEYEVIGTDDTFIHIQYTAEGKSKKVMFDREHAEQLLTDINSNPKYNQ